MTLLDAQQCIVFGDTLASCRCTSLDLAGAERNDDIGDNSVLSLATTVRNHDTPTVRLGKLCTENTINMGHK